MPRCLHLAVVLAFLVASCASDETGIDTFRDGVATSLVVTDAVTTSPLVTSPVTTSPVRTSLIFDVPAVLTDFGIGTVRLDGSELSVAIAGNPGLRARGLMGVTELGSLDGMVFVWDRDTGSTFWMKDTLIALDIAWFDAGGRFVSQLTMLPCDDQQVCPTHAAEALYRYALEMPQGTMPELSEASMLELVAGF